MCNHGLRLQSENKILTVCAGLEIKLGNSRTEFQHFEVIFGKERDFDCASKLGRSHNKFSKKRKFQVILGEKMGAFID